ncbi:MAG: glutaredoxin family protein [Methylacidiphilaceae bacterium]|jgi:glutaredoxin|uniref:Glutaredoxin.1 n=1 Tax=Methylacidimicrobium tartarophylax TaxID=1041768 RepID=A0A5E6M5Y0_9BACT|nr:glutaredoxin family protein [Methylacidimicrobium tartarophylax]MDD2677193.1 glutaredoxin family protein [Candidatus Methylacidiphilaceae bacterium]VVM04756.1 Putative glutaredoxin.1 [Methylacidimicrobium tartarophylax]
MQRVTLYVKTGCPWCVEVEAVLQRYRISYDRLDVLRNSEAYRRMKAISGQSQAPTMEWEDEVLADFGAEELEAFLRDKDLS